MEEHAHTMALSMAGLFAAYPLGRYVCNRFNSRSADEEEETRRRRKRRRRRSGEGGRRRFTFEKFTRGKPLSVRAESCRRWMMPGRFGPRLVAPGSPQVVRRKTIARQWPPAPTPRTPAPAPAAATGKKEPSNDHFAYKIHALARARPSTPLSIALIKGERPGARSDIAHLRSFSASDDARSRRLPRKLATAIRPR